MGQGHTLSLEPADGWEEGLRSHAEWLGAVDLFYSSLGGIVGYQLKCLELISEGLAAEAASAEAPVRADAAPDAVTLHKPNGPDLASSRELAEELAAEGLLAMPRMAEIYPLGGAGDRLGLTCDVTGEALPAALLPYAGRTLLESLVRNLQAREYLHSAVHGSTPQTPVAIMTSPAKGNHGRIAEVLERNGYFGRGEDGFRLFCQPLVPVVCADDGRWLLTGPLKVSSKPGGHGAIWKLMLDHGVFDWFAGRGARGALVRQISNPMAGTDTTLLALAGAGERGDKAFGFASCERIVGAAEGMNVLLERQRGGDGAGPSSYEYGVTNIEYTEFERLGIADVPAAPGSNVSAFPANTNILYIGLNPAEAAVRAGVEAGGGAALPGMIFNLKKKMEWVDAAAGGEIRTGRAGRLECTMQNLADELTHTSSRPLTEDRHADLPTFAVFNERRKVTSSAKKARKPGSTALHQTPDGSFLDLMRNADELLTGAGVDLPAIPSVEDYLASGPSFIFLMHPALGPLWSVVRQKIVGGAIAKRAEVVLEIAELRWADVDVCGSFRLVAREPLGRTGADGLLEMGVASPRARLERVSVRNAGVDWEAESNSYWRHEVTRIESCSITLEGDAQLDARDVTLDGGMEITVPAGHCLRMRPAEDGAVARELIPLAELEDSWEWRYSRGGGDAAVKLDLSEVAVSVVAV